MIRVLSGDNGAKMRLFLGFRAGCVVGLPGAACWGMLMELMGRVE
jgi:hypothetical protein